jgi:hypothetical protein
LLLDLVGFMILRQTIICFDLLVVSWVLSVPTLAQQPPDSAQFASAPRTPSAAASASEPYVPYH